MKKAKKALNVATFGATGLMEKSLDPFKAALGLAAPVGGDTGGDSTAATAPNAIPTALDPDVTAAREAQKKRQQAYSGLSANVLTRPGGLTGGANTQMKTLLGS